MVVDKNDQTIFKVAQNNPEILKKLNNKPARITINGKRHYETPFFTGPAASVTAIISETASQQSKRKLEMWAKNNPGMKEAAAEQIGRASCRERV